jgi:hypothetical protein
MLRSPLRRRTPLQSRIRPAVPADVRRALAARSEGRCETQLPGCLGTATDPCHRVGRAQGGADTLANVHHSCRVCHRWTHDRPKEANELGLILWSRQVPELEPMAYRNAGWVLLGTVVTWL